MAPFEGDFSDVPTDRTRVSHIPRGLADCDFLHHLDEASQCVAGRRGWAQASAGHDSDNVERLA